MEAAASGHEIIVQYLLDHVSASVTHNRTCSLLNVNKRDLPVSEDVA